MAAAEATGGGRGFSGGIRGRDLRPPATPTCPAVARRAKADARSTSHQRRRAPKNSAHFNRAARLTNTERRLHCPSLRARRTRASQSRVRECEADWSATCDEFSQEDTSQRCRARRTRSPGNEDHKGSIGRRRAFCQQRCASVGGGNKVKRRSERDTEALRNENVQTFSTTERRAFVWSAAACTRHSTLLTPYPLGSSSVNRIKS